MGKRGSWCSAVKRVFSSSDAEEKEAKAEKAEKPNSKKKWRLAKSKHSDPAPSSSAAPEATPAAAAPPPPPPPPPGQPAQPPAEEAKSAEMETDHNKHAYSVALASAVAAEAAAVAAQAAAEVVRLTATTSASPRTPVRSKEESAAIKIQTAFRAYLARRALRALRGLVRLKSLVDGGAVKRQTEHTLYCTQTVMRVQTQIHSRRVKIEEEKQAIQRQLQLKHARELEKSKIDDDWDRSHQSKEQIEVSLMMKQEAAIRRERALAYAFSHQWRNSSSRTVTPMFTDPGNPNWGWSWMERWMSARPWERRAAADKEPKDRASAKSISHCSAIGTYVPRDTASAQTPTALNKPSHPPSRQSPSSAEKIRPASPRTGRLHKEDDVGSITSLRSERPRRRSLGGGGASLLRDDVSMASTPALPSYMQSTESTRAKSRYRACPLAEKLELSERTSVASSSAKKRLSFPIADKPGRVPPPDKPLERVRRHSDPPKMEVASLRDVPVHDH